MPSNSKERLGLGVYHLNKEEHIYTEVIRSDETKGLGL